MNSTHSQISVYLNTTKIRPKASSLHLGGSVSHHPTFELIAYDFQPSFFF